MMTKQMIQKDIEAMTAFVNDETKSEKAKAMMQKSIDRMTKMLEDAPETDEHEHDRQFCDMIAQFG